MADLNYPLRKSLKEIRDSFKRPKGTFLKEYIDGMVRAQQDEDLDWLTQMKDNRVDVIERAQDEEWNGPLYPQPSAELEVGHSPRGEKRGRDDHLGTHLAGDHCH